MKIDIQKINPFSKYKLGKDQKRDNNGKFTAGSGGLSTLEKFNWKRSLPIVVTVALVGGFLVYRSFATVALLGNDGELVTISSTRAYDSRSSGGALRGGQQRSVPVQSVAKLPSDAKAVVVNVTAVSPSATGFARIWPNGEPMPKTSQLNFYKGQGIANELIIPVNGNGFKIWNSRGNTHFVFDVVGYYTNDPEYTTERLATQFDNKVNSNDPNYQKVEYVVNTTSVPKQNGGVISLRQDYEERLQNGQYVEPSINGFISAELKLKVSQSDVLIEVYCTYQDTKCETADLNADNRPDSGTAETIIMPFTGNKSGSYKITYQIEVDKPNHPGVWQLISITDNNRTYDIVRQKIATVRDGVNVGFTGGFYIDALQTLKCKNPDSFEFNISNYLGDSQPIELESYGGQVYRGQSYGGTDAKDYCPGLTRIDHSNSGLSDKKIINYVFGVEKSDRDFTPPKIERVTQDGRRLIVEASDNQGVTRISADNFGFYTDNDGTWGKNVTRSVSLNRYPDDFTPGTYDIEIEVVDSSGNTIKVVKQFTIQ